jgi:hypothetical protein
MRTTTLQQPLGTVAKYRYKSFVVLMALVLLLGVTMTHTTTSHAQDDVPERDSVALTVYNQGTALVQDRRTFTFDAGENPINFTDVAAQIDATSVTFRSLTDPTGTSVIEQNYAYDLVNVSALLERYLDETIRVTTQDGTVYDGALLSGRGGEIILRQADGTVAVVNQAQARDVQFPNLPDGLITRPTLRWLVSAMTGGEQQVELTYLTGGMTWTADYNVLLATGNTSLDLNGWITLNNNSGTSFADAQLKLVAGDVNRLPEQQARGEFREEMLMMADAAAAPPVEQREIFEYQLYEIQRPVTVANNETKQVEFVRGANVPATTFFVYNGSPQFYGYYGVNQDQYYGSTGITDVQTYLEFDTSEENGLGADLPAGRVRVYQADTDGAPVLIGENQIDHTPEGEMVQFYLGNAFDLVGERTQTNFVYVSDRVIQETYEIRLRNRKDEGSVEVRVPETMFRWSEWEILESSIEYTKVNSNSIEFRANVPAGEEVVLTYTVQYSWR